MFHYYYNEKMKVGPKKLAYAGCTALKPLNKTANTQDGAWYCKFCTDIRVFN